MFPLRHAPQYPDAWAQRIKHCEDRYQHYGYVREECPVCRLDQLFMKSYDERMARELKGLPPPPNKP